MEQLFEYYKKLSSELDDALNKTLREYEHKLSDTIKQYEGQLHQSMMRTIRRELDMMKMALDNGNLSQATYHKLLAESYLNLLIK